MNRLIEQWDTSGFTRHEYKYLLKPELAERVADFLSPYIEVDSYADSENGNIYTVRSIYFDSPDFKCFHEKIAGLPNREKFRLRTYNHNSEQAPIFLESKRKNCRRGMKNRALINDKVFTAIINRDHSALTNIDIPNRDKEVFDRLFFHMYRKTYFPVLLVTYEREPYISPDENRVRITFDKNIRGMVFPQADEIFEEARLEPVIGDRTVLEIKFDNFLPRWIGDLTTIFHLTPQAMSKYCTGVARFLGEKPGIKDGFRHV